VHLVGIEPRQPLQAKPIIELDQVSIGMKIT
jgi:hypothetical protein